MRTFELVKMVLEMDEKRKSKELPPAWLCRKYMAIYAVHGFRRFKMSDAKMILGEGNSTNVIICEMVKSKLIESIKKESELIYKLRR